MFTFLNAKIEGITTICIKKAQLSVEFVATTACIYDK
jgi:hypothetical protein